MEKKVYAKPSMKVYEFERQPQVLVGSRNGGGMEYTTRVPGFGEHWKKPA